jgi:anti-anti-sigma factor
MDAGTIDLQREDGAWVVTLRGEHDLSTASQLEQVLARSFSGGSAVIADLSPAEFIDSTIVRVLVCGQGESDRIVLVAPPGCVARRLFDLIRVPDAVPTYETRAEALEHLGADMDGVVPATGR